MDEVRPTQQSTSILEALYFIRAKNRGDLSFADCMDRLVEWAKAVIAEAEATPAEQDECPSGQ